MMLKFYLFLIYLHSMRFDLDHDWQGNISTPRARVGENAKTNLLLLLCATWLFIGLIGHSPWKPLESSSISVIKIMLGGGSVIAPVSASNQYIINPPLYYLSAAMSVKLLGAWLPMHDAARMISGFWMLITLLLVGMTGRELWGKGFGRQTTLTFIGSLGLVLNAHMLTPAISALTGSAMGFYALALIARRPNRGSILLAGSLVLSFLSTGLLPFTFLMITAIALPCLFNNWRNRRFIRSCLTALLIASPFLLAWPLLCMHKQPELFHLWWAESLSDFHQVYHLFFLETLLWYAWPPLPLALWALWRYRKRLWGNTSFQLSITFFVVAWACIGVAAEHKEIYALPLLIPLTALAGAGIETLKRGAASALNWFGLILFGMMSGLIWLGWTAMTTGSPAKIKERLHFLSGLTELSFNVLSLMLAMMITLIWLFTVFRSQHSNRSSATNWAIGLTCVWTLLMTLWLPMIDSARSYQNVFSSLQATFPQRFACVSSRDVNDAQQDLFYYYTDLKLRTFEKEQRIDCDLYLIQDERGKAKIDPGDDWKLIWHGKRISERQESFRLFQYVIK